MVQDPGQLAKVLMDIQEAALRGTEAARSNPFGAVFILQNVKLISGTQANLQHGLGVAWRYAYIIHAFPNAQACTLVDSGAQPQGTSRASVAAVIPTGTGIYDVLLASG